MRLNWRKSVIGLVVLAVVVLLINVVFFNAMPKPKRLALPVEVDYTLTDAQFARSASALLGKPLLTGNRVEILRDGVDIYAAKLDAIKRAERSITFETYEFWGEEAAGSARC